MFLSGIGDASAKNCACVDFPVPGVPVRIITGACRLPDAILYFVDFGQLQVAETDGGLMNLLACSWEKDQLGFVCLLTPGSHSWKRTL